MKDDYLPILIVPAIPYNGGIRFLREDTQIDLSAKSASVVWTVLLYCNGRNNPATISSITNLSTETVNSVLLQLQGLRLIEDSRQQYLHFHEISYYPTVYSRNLTQKEVIDYTNSPQKELKRGELIHYLNEKDSILFLIQKKRFSCRNFSNRKLSVDQIGSICDFAYSIKNHAVPSGGALYPLKIYVLVEQDQKGLSSGYYEYDSINHSLILFDRDVDAEQLKYCFNQDEMPFGSSVQIVIAADLERQTYKYSNRGYRLTLIEAGHVAENILLLSADFGLGTCELGGVLDKPLMNELSLSTKGIYPLLAIALGYPSNHQASPKTDDERAKYLEDNVGQGKPVEALSVTTFENDGSFFGGTATYRNHYSEIHYAGATGQSYIDAAYKAAIEGYERWCSGQLRVDYHGPAKKILNWISPIELAPLTAEQSEKCELKSFTVDLPINWTLGKNYNNESVYVPSDLVYYGHCVDDNCIYYGHSSGVAAFTSFEEAQRRALIELIERDALMRNWYSRTPPNIIEIECLSIHAKKRIKYWSQKDRIIKILEIPSLYGRVVEAIIIGKEYPFFVSGAAATIDPLLTDAAVNKALQEAEYNLLLCLKYPDQSIIDPKAVITPAEHGKVYHLEENAKTLKWLWSGKTVNQFEKMEELSYSELLQKLKVITVTLSDETSKIIVVRVFSSKLVPINFGYNSAHYTHPEIKEKVCSESLLMPHYFA